MTLLAIFEALVGANTTWETTVRGVFLQGEGISQPSILLACFNSAGGANAGL